MTFAEYTQRSVSSPAILVEMDISSINTQWVNCGAGIWKVNFDGLYPEVDSSLLDGFTAQDFWGVGSIQIDTIFLTKVSSLLLVSSTYQSFYWDNSDNTLYVTLPNYSEPILFETIFVGVIYGYTKKEFTPIGTSQIYEGRLGKVPSIGYARDPLYFGKISYPSVSINLINADGEFDQFSDTFNIYGNQVRIYFGYEEIDYSEYQLIYTGYIEKINVNEEYLQIQISDLRKKLSDKIYYECEDKNALDAIVELLQLAGIYLVYNDVYFNTTAWEIAKALVPNITITMKENSTEEVIKMIEDICTSVFGLFIIESDGRYSFKIIDNSATATVAIPRSDILNSNLEIEYSPEEVLSSVRVSYAKILQGNTSDYKTWLIDTSRENDIFKKYKVKIQNDFDTCLVDSTAAQNFADTILDYSQDVHGRLKLEVPMKYYSLEFGGVVNAYLDRIQSTMLGNKKCEILSKYYNLEEEKIELELRVV